MTNYKQATGNHKRRGNQKDRWTAPKPKSQHDEFLALGFTQSDEYWNRLEYTLPGDFPTFVVAPGTIGTEAGLVATYTMIDVEKKVLFAYGTPPAMIKAGLEAEAELWTDQCDDEICDDDEPEYWPEAGEEIDIDDYMTGRWVRS